MEQRSSLILATVNQGFTDEVMDTARKAGARGGTIIRGRWVGEESFQQLSGVARQAEKEIIARKAAALVEDGDCVYVDSGTTTVGMLKYLQGKRITIVSSSTELLDNLPIKNAKCILLGGEVRDDLESVLGALTEKMISDMYFDKAFIGANGYIPDGGIYTYDDREARKKVIVKDHSKVVYVLMDTSKKNKYAFSKVFDLGEAILITEEEDNR